MSVRTELRLFIQAVNRGWDIPDQAKAEAKATADAVLADPQSNNSERRTAEVVLARLRGWVPPAE